MKDLQKNILRSITTNLVVLNNLLAMERAPSNKKLSTNGALAYALKQNKIGIHELILLGEQKARSLKYVGPVVWEEAKHLTTPQYI